MTDPKSDKAVSERLTVVGAWSNRCNGSPSNAAQRVLRALVPVLGEYGMVAPGRNAVRDRVAKANAGLAEIGSPWRFKWLQPCDPRRNLYDWPVVVVLAPLDITE